MKKYLLFGILLVFSVVLVAGKPDTSLVPTMNTKADVSLTIPKHAIEVAPGVFSLGTAVDVDGRDVEGFAVFEKRENAKPGSECGNGICEPGEKSNCAADCGGGGGTTSSCFSHLAKGAKWKTLEPWVVNPSNTQGISADYILSDVAADIQKWEDVSVNILGGGSSTAESLVADLRGQFAGRGFSIKANGSQEVAIEIPEDLPDHITDGEIVTMIGDLQKDNEWVTTCEVVP